MAENKIHALVKSVFTELEEKKAEDVTVLDIGQLSTIADYFIIATGANARHLDALRDSAEEVIEKNGGEIRQIEGKGTSGWILIDCRDFVIHLFDASNRTFYDLARIWKVDPLIDPLTLD